MPVISCLKEYSVTLYLNMVIMQQINLSVKLWRRRAVSTHRCCSETRDTSFTLTGSNTLELSCFTFIMCSTCSALIGQSFSDVDEHNKATIFHEMFFHTSLKTPLTTVSSSCRVTPQWEVTNLKQSSKTELQQKHKCLVC